MIFNKEKDFELFLRGVAKLTPVEFCGLATFLGVALTTPSENPEMKSIPRDSSEVLSDMMNKFESLNRKGRRQIMNNVIKPILKRG